MKWLSIGLDVVMIALIFMLFLTDKLTGFEYLVFILLYIISSNVARVAHIIKKWDHEMSGK